MALFLAVSLLTAAALCAPVTLVADEDDRLCARIGSFVSFASRTVKYEGAGDVSFVQSCEEPAADHSLWNLGAAGSQPWISAVLLSLEAQGLLSLSDPVNALLEAPHSAIPDVELRHVLSHTSGLDVDSFQTLDDLYLADAPGTVRRPVGANSHLAVRVAEAVTGRLFADLVVDLAEAAGVSEASYFDHHTSSILATVTDNELILSKILVDLGDLVFSDPELLGFQPVCDDLFANCGREGWTMISMTSETGFVARVNVAAGTITTVTTRQSWFPNFAAESLAAKLTLL